MATKGEACIFWCSNTGDTENTLANSEKVEFGIGAVAPDGKTGIIQITNMINKHQPQDDEPYASSTRKKDTGFNGAEIMLEIFFDEDAIGTAQAIARLRKWIAESNSVPIKFPHNRIGIRNDYRPEWNLTPSATAGYKITAFKTTTNLEHQNQTIGSLTLTFSGDGTEIG